MNGRKIPIHSLTPAVEAMIQIDGVYLAGDSKNPKFVIPMMSMGGKIFTLIKGNEIDPMQFLPTATVSGPFLPNQPEA